MIRPQQIPVFDGTIDDIVEQTVNFVAKNVRRTEWSNDEINRKFANRSTSEILFEGVTCYMNPCLDLTLVTSEVLKKQGIKHSIIMQQLLHPDDQESRVHFAIEFDFSGTKHYLDYNRLNIVVHGRGEYINRQDYLTEVCRVRVNSEETNNYQAPYSFLGLTSQSEMITLFPGYNFEKQLRKLRFSNTVETYQRYLESLEEMHKILGREDAFDKEKLLLIQLSHYHHKQ